MTAKRFSTTLEKRSKSESNLKQSDRDRSKSRDKNTCSSNSDITDSRDGGKGYKMKYFNTAPARLKPGEKARRLTDILKPKSSSCASILSEGSGSREEGDKDDKDKERRGSQNQSIHEDILPMEVMSSFQAAVNVLEKPGVIPNPYFEQLGKFIPFLPDVKKGT